MNRFRRGGRSALVVLAGAALAAGVVAALNSTSLAAAAHGIASQWKNRPIQVDGATDDWPVLDLVGDDISVAAANDGHDLYLAVATSDLQRRRQLLMTGLIVWLDSGGGKKETYGIRFPGAGLAGAGRAGRRAGGRPGVNRDPRDGDPGGPDDAGADVALPRLTTIELLGPGKEDRRRLELAAVPEVAAATGLHEGTLLYELRLPLAARTDAQPFGIGARTDRVLGLGLDTPKLERPVVRGGPDGGDPGGGRGGGRGGGGYGRGGGLGGGGRGGGRGGAISGRGGMAQMKDLKIWTTLALARGPA